MPATTSGGIKAVIEGAGLGLAAYRDQAPDNAALPHVTVDEGVSVVPRQDGGYDQQVEHTVTELVTVDLWQQHRDGRGRPAEDYGLSRRLVRALRSASMPDSPTRVYGVKVNSVVRLVEDANNVVHHAITCEVKRQE